ncbi:hypothetical protein B0H16DRAFT_1406818 [Mycena metata]|uniref:Smr domain-containing protein n=1 Tax=Mycena metata TaxID=1033252 RepID=A0AAD7NVW2_9AGAR|nr:hypothetical protein B0H16DRAFT_1406818 [Mycena metata]
MDAIFESLQREFCPPLDSSLLAALLADIVVDSSSTDVSADPQIVALRSILIELAVHADEEAVPTADDIYDETTSGSSVLDFCTTTTTSTTSASDLSGESRRSAAARAASASSFNSPLGFLQAALPHIPTERLRRALASSASADQDDDDTESELDMWELISALLSEETEKEMRERDLDEEELSALELAAAAPWETVETKRANGRKAKAKSKIKAKIALSDVRQQQHATTSSSARRRTTTDGLDPWAQLVSLSTHIARFLPPHPPAFFQSYFHMPQYAAPYDALCAALHAISGAATNNNNADDGDDVEHTATLFGLLDVLLPAYSSNSTSSTEALITDVQLALKAAQGRGEDAFELVRVLRDLDEDRESGVWGAGVYHSPVTSPFSEKSTSWGAATVNGGGVTLSRGASMSGTSASKTLPTGPAPTPPPPNLRSPPPGPTNKPKNAYQWQAVPPRRRATAPTIYPHAMRVPVYERDVNGVRVKANAGAERAGAVVGVEGASDFRRRALESMRKRDELLKEAARMWQRGNRRTMGGEVAWYFAERAREFQEVARREALNAARVMVSAKRTTPDTVDLHGVTAAEAVVIVNEILADGGWSAERPLKIITGRGTHSAGRVSVLKPAVRKALEEEGWVVGGWEGGLSVRGRVGGRR